MDFRKRAEQNILKHPGIWLDMDLEIIHLSEKQIIEIEKRMRPGECSRGGFLNQTERLEEIIKRDAKVVENSKFSYKQISDRIETIIGKARRHQSLYFYGQSSLTKEQIRGFSCNSRPGIPIEDKYIIKATAWRGLQDCPYRNYHDPCKENPNYYSYRYSYLECELENIRTRQKVYFPGLIIHLLRHHQFFEGSTKYRVEPQQLIDVLELEIGKDYSPHYVNETEWSPYMSTSSTDMDNRNRFDMDQKAQEIVKFPQSRKHLSEDVTIYIGKETCILVAKSGIVLDKGFHINGIKWPYMKIRKGIQYLKPRENTFIPLDNEKTKNGGEPRYARNSARWLFKLYAAMVSAVRIFF